MTELHISGVDELEARFHALEQAVRTRLAQDAVTRAGKAVYSPIKSAVPAKQRDAVAIIVRVYPSRNISMAIVGMKWPLTGKPVKSLVVSTFDANKNQAAAILASTLLVEIEK